MSAADLAALIERVEQADAADGTVNADVLMACGWSQVAGEAFNPHGDRALRIPACLSNTDDAISLLPAGWSYLDLLRFGDGTVECSVELLGAKVRQFAACGRSPAAAITATALRIKEAGHA